jgi:hypothetical protein
MDVRPVQEIQDHLQKLLNDPSKNNALWMSPPLQVLSKIEWHQPFKKLAPPAPGAQKTPPKPQSQPAASPPQPVCAPVPCGALVSRAINSLQAITPAASPIRPNLIHLTYSTAFQVPVPVPVPVQQQQRSVLAAAIPAGTCRV